jgi:hypothetical protein
MLEFMAVAVLVVAVGGVVVGLAAWTRYLRAHPDKRGGASAIGGLVGGTDFVWHPEAANAATEADEQQRLVVPAPTPDPHREA